MLVGFKLCSLQIRLEGSFRKTTRTGVIRPRQNPKKFQSSKTLVRLLSQRCELEMEILCFKWLLFAQCLCETSCALTYFTFLLHFNVSTKMSFDHFKHISTWAEVKNCLRKKENQVNLLWRALTSRAGRPDPKKIWFESHEPILSCPCWVALSRCTQKAQTNTSLRGQSLRVFGQEIVFLSNSR